MRAILTYHSIDDSGSVISVAPSAFRAHMAWLASGRVRVVSVPALLALDDSVDAVAVTFDDGYANVATVAAPLMRAHGITATIFVVAAHAGGDNRWRNVGDKGIPVLPLLGWDALGSLRDAGNCIGAHSRTHPRMTTLAAAQLDDELGAAAAVIGQRVGALPDGVAYPYGDVDTRVAAVAARTYRWGCTTEFRTVGARDAPLRLPRLDAWYFRDATRLAAWGTPGFRAWVWARQRARTLRRSVLRLVGDTP